MGILDSSARAVGVVSPSSPPSERTTAPPGVIPGPILAGDGSECRGEDDENEMACVRVLGSCKKG